MLALVVLGVAGILWQAREAREQAHLATLEAAKAGAIKEFLLDIFNANSDRHPDGARARQTTAEELLMLASEKIQQVEHQDPELRAELLGTLGTLNLKIDRPEEAQALFQARIDLVTKEFGAQDARLVEPCISMADLYLLRGKFPEARETAQKAKDILDARGERVSTARGRIEHMLGYAAFLSINDRDDRTAMTHFAQEVAILEQLPPAKELVLGLLALGKTHMSIGDAASGIPLFERAIAVGTRHLGPQDVTVATAHQAFAGELIRARRLEDAGPHLDAALGIVLHAYGPESSKAGIVYMDMGRLKQQQGRYLEAVRDFDRALALRQKMYGAKDLGVGLARSGLAQALFGSGDFARAATVLEECLVKLADSCAAYIRVPDYRTRANLGLEQRRADAALADVTAALPLLEAAGKARTPEAAQFHVIRGEALVQQRKFDEARASLDAAADILKGDESAMAYPVVASLHLAGIELDNARGNAASAADRAAALLATLRARADRQTLWALEDAAWRRLADAQRLAGKTTDACASLGNALQLRATRALPTDPRLAKTRTLLERCGG